MKPFVLGWVYYPVTKFNNLAAIKEQLTVRPVQFKGKEKPDPIKVYDDISFDGFIGLPKRYAVDKLRELYGDLWINRVDDFSAYVPTFNPPRLPDVKHARAHKDQPFLVKQVYQELITHYNSLFVADTGVGKTAIALHVAGTLGQKPLILVKSEKLKNQWIEEIQALTGIDRSEIGIVQGAKCETDKQILVGMVQTLFRGKYNAQLKDEIGMMIFDEVHNLGADEFSKCLGAVNARYNLAMTATLDRDDGKDEIYKLHFGTGDVVAEAEALPIKVHVLPYRRMNGPNWGENREGKILCVSKDWTRNCKIAKLICKLVAAGRTVMIFSEYKKHLRELFRLAVEFGLPPEKAGLVYNGSADMQEACGMRTKLKEKEYHDYVKDNCQVMLTVYGQMREGLSYNRFDTGCDATPQKKAKQLIGRVRRPYENKNLSLWYTLNDLDDETLSGYCEKRILEYKADRTVELVRHDGGI